MEVGGGNLTGWTLISTGRLPVDENCYHHLRSMLGVAVFIY